MKTTGCSFVLLLSLCLSVFGARAEERPERDAQRAAEAWLSQVDAGDYPMSWLEASRYFQGAIPEAAWSASLRGAREPLGKVLSRKLQNAQHARSVPGAPDGNYVVMQFDTRFQNKKAAVETVTFMQEKDGSWKAAGYYVK